MAETPFDIATRRDLAGHFEHRMNRSYVALRQGRRLPYDSSLVKTYLVEAHVPGGGGHDDVVRLLRGIACDSTGPFRAPHDAVRETAEELFVALVLPTARPGAEARIYVDASDPRFWLLHSMEASHRVDWCVQRLTRSSTNLDTAWLFVALLERVANMGAFRGLGLDYDRRPLLDSHDGDEPTVTFLKMQLWGNRAREVLETLRRAEAFPHETTLAKVKVKFWLDGRREAFSVDDVKFNGKVTARGTSFQCHLALLGELYGRYARIIEAIESRARVTWEEVGGGRRVSGVPVYFRFARDAGTPTELCARLFTCAEPFRLWGVPTPVSDDYIRVSAVDLHAGQPLALEITREWIRVYLHRSSCGNTIARLLTNLQHTIDAQVEAEIDGLRLSEL